MARERLDAASLRQVVVVYRDLLRAHQDQIDRLNVYPVPDGDTGTNMTLTLDAVVRELAEAADDMTDVARAIGHGSLMGARGNSGVILSQVLRGIAQTVTERDDVDGKLLAQAFVTASELAYGAVGRPVEGTILTVVRQAGEAAAEVAGGGGDLLAVLDAARAAGAAALADTPSLLPVLAEAGVVDAGGTGWLLFLDAALVVVDDRPRPEPDPAAAAAGEVRAHADHGDHGESDLRYEVMYLLEAPDESIAAFRDVWAGIGDSIVVVGGDGTWNCHIHTDDIGASIEAAIQVGRPYAIRVTDLAEQVEELRWVREGARRADPLATVETPPVVTAVVAVSPAEGTGRIFHSLRVQRLVAGGQSMNPATEDLLAAVEDTAADEVVILPNNANIVGVARQVGSLTDRPVHVVATTSVVQGFAALLEYDPLLDGATNAAAMTSAADTVLSGEVTRAVRATSSPAGPIEEGDWLGLDADGVRVIAPTPVDAATRLLGGLVTDDHELVTVIVGEGATGAATRQIVAWLEEQCPGVEVETHHGGQPHYPYLFGIE